MDLSVPETERRLGDGDGGDEGDGRGVADGALTRLTTDANGVTLTR